MPGKRPTDPEIVLRTETMVTLVLSGLRRAEILRYVAEKTDWGVKERTVDNYIARAYKAIAAAHQDISAHQLDLTQIRLIDLYKRSMNIQDYKTCLAVVREIAKLNGLFPLDAKVLEAEALVERLKALVTAAEAKK